MTSLENTIIKYLFDTGKIKLYYRYVDKTLILIKPDNIQLVQDLFNTFHKNLHFTVDSFKNEVQHFLNIIMSAHVHYDSFIPWNYKEIVGFVVLLQELNMFVL